MKKKLITFIIIDIFVLCLGIVFCMPLFSDFKINLSYYGAFTSLVSLVMCVFAVFFLNFEKVDDSTVPPIDVDQEITAVKYEKNGQVPNMVIVNEKLTEKGENK